MPCEFEIVENNYYDLVLDRIDPTWADRFRINELEDNYDCEDSEVGMFELYDYSWHARPKHHRLNLYDTLEDAEDARFQIFEGKFESYSDSIYYYDYDEAFESLANVYDVSVETLKSIEHHKECKLKILEIRKQKAIKNNIKNKERIHKLAEIYSKMIDKIDNESYKETCRRLSNAIGEKIESSVFHCTVKIIRK